MANTSRKRPPPTSHGPAAGGGGTNGSGSAPPGAPLGIDALLAKYARNLPPGGSVSITLVKGPTSKGADPIAARKAAARAAKRSAKFAAASGMSSGLSSGNESDGAGATSGGGGGVVELEFPRVAKFPDTVTPPDFLKGSLREGRMYEEEVPLAKDESDEEESTAYRDPSAGGAPKKKKRRWRRHDARPRRWVLQEKAEFFDRIRKRKQRSSNGGGDDDEEEQATSNQYHGVAEANSSKYVFLSVAPPASDATAATSMAMEQISIRPVHGFHSFGQPRKVASLTMEEAENAIERQRNVVTRYMMHGKLSAQGGSSETAAIATGGGRGRPRALGPAPKAMSRARLLGKLAGGVGDDGDDDDVMGDVRFSTSSRGSSRARKELLSSLGDEGMTIDDDGVMGGANDSEFGGRRRFARVSNKKDAEEEGGKKAGGRGGGGATSTGFEAAAMEEGFYQRDVAAEYEALDYDANEQFDDDDVNVGEDEMMDDGGGYGGDFHDSGDDDALDSDEAEDGEDALQGMATASGLKAMLAKARGESPVNVSAENAAVSGAGADTLEPLAEGGAGKTAENGGMDSLLNAAKKTAEEMQKKPTAADDNNAALTSAASEKAKAAAAAAAGGIEKDKDGKRLITLEAVRREIWVNGGSITSKRLMKKFEVGKEKERQELFKAIVLELCQMKKDVDGSKKLVLKQHYSKM